MSLRIDTTRILRGQVWWLLDNLNTDTCVQGKTRPWLVVSSDDRNKTAPVFTCVPITTREEIRGNYQVYFKNGDRDQVVLCEQIRTKPIEEFDNRSYMFTVSEEILEQVDEALKVQLGLSNSKVGKWGPKERRVFLRDFEEMTIGEMSEKYNLTESTIKGYKSKFLSKL